MELTLIMADIVRISHFWQYTMKKNETLNLYTDKFQNKNNYGLADVFSDAYMNVNYDSAQTSRRVSVVDTT